MAAMRDKAMWGVQSSTPRRLVLGDYKRVMQEQQVYEEVATSLWPSARFGPLLGDFAGIVASVLKDNCERCAAFPTRRTCMLLFQGFIGSCCVRTVGVKRTCT